MTSINATANIKRQGATDAQRAQPRYLQISNELMMQIAAGQFAVGSHLPSEFELCRRYRISRHTVREALRRLHESGLVVRRRGSGTEVIARTHASSYKQPINSIADLLQYGADTKVHVQRKGRIACGASLAPLLDCEKGKEWLRIETLRSRPDSPHPICLANLYLNVDLPDIDDRVSTLEGPVSATVGSPALRALRRYFDENGRLIELSDSIHPGDRFSYVMHLLRD
jgi:DNA-binding GntR family transcriptional regulator